VSREMIGLTVDQCGRGELDALAPVTSIHEAEECDQVTCAAHDSETKTAENQLHWHHATTAEYQLRWHHATTAAGAGVMWTQQCHEDVLLHLCHSAPLSAHLYHSLSHLCHVTARLVHLSQRSVRQLSHYIAAVQCSAKS